MMSLPSSLHFQFVQLGLPTEQIQYNTPLAALIEQALTRGEGQLTRDGALTTRTDPRTGRSAHDRFIVDSPATETQVDWNNVNRPIRKEVFQHLLERMGAYAQGKPLFVRDAIAGADPHHQLPVRIITEKAWHSLFAYNMFREASPSDLDNFEPGFTVLDLCDFQADPERDGTHSEAFILVHFDLRLVLIGGTAYAGEIKKSIFSVLNFLLPQRNVLSMHCSANVGPDGDTAIFFGLSGTGKTTLSANPDRTLIGDDEHGWSENGVFNIEGGCYAKTIHLSPTGEPEIYATTRRFGTILENVILDPKTRTPDFDDASITENTRASYPLTYIPNASATGRAGHPHNVVMLTADAFGVLPPIARLTPEQAMYHFLSGYTAKVAGTEAGVTEPRATFSACFGAPFMVLPATTYARMLGDRLKQHDVRCWLVNTGWTGGPYGIGKRMNLRYTRAMLTAALEGQLDEVPTQTDPCFGLHVPIQVPGVPNRVLDPRSTWSDADAYDAQAHRLAEMFSANFEQYADAVSPGVLAAGPLTETVSS